MKDRDEELALNAEFRGRLLSRLASMERGGRGELGSHHNNIDAEELKECKALRALQRKEARGATELVGALCT